jgi:predicted CXXCH cytochrome family protein
MQGNDFMQSTMYHRGLRCFDCHQVHSNRNPSNLIATGNELCLGCHTKYNPAGLKGTVSEHTHHPENSPGSQCTACHMPNIAQTLGNKQHGDIFVASHTFRFISPTLTVTSGIPNPCTNCHKDKTSAWAAAQLRSWTTESPMARGELNDRHPLIFPVRHSHRRLLDFLSPPVVQINSASPKSEAPC